jgi:ribonuclease HII
LPALHIRIITTQEIPAGSGLGFADNKGYGTPAHAQAILDLGRLSPVHRRKVRSKAYAALNSQAA